MCRITGQIEMPYLWQPKLHLGMVVYDGDGHWSRGSEIPRFHVPRTSRQKRFA